MRLLVGMPGTLPVNAMTPPSAVTDALGTVHPIAAENPRIVSLVPSLTELLCDLGLASQIVGRTGFCVHPRDTVRSIPKLGGTKDVDIAGVKALEPTHVILNVDENRRELADALADFVEHVVVTHPVAPADNRDLFDLFGTLFRRDDEARVLTQRFDAAAARLDAIPDKPPARVLYLIWREPWMTITADTYISRMLALIDWHTVPAVADARYPQIELQQFNGQVDRVLLSSEPYPFRGKHVAEIEECFGSRVTVSLVDGEMLSWYGSRAIAGLDYLAKLSADARQAAA